MASRRDPMQRLARREAEWVSKRSEVQTGAGMMRLALRFYAGLGVAWAAALAVHWWLFSSPRWLVLLHSLAFVLTIGYWSAAALMLRTMQRRMPDFFDD